ncbi:MAG: aminotransferase class I/II-fold pyridoxal phosphate-dependent enzyme [Verrucomicrobiales bacterium]
MFDPIRPIFQQRLQEIRDAGLWKTERVIDSDQANRIRLAGGREVINMCANNYLGLANHPEVEAAARESLARWGYGLASVRFICGTQSLHRQLEEAISEFLGMEDTILYTSCFDANGGLFETVLKEEDAVVSDQLNHASIIDGIRLCKAGRYRYANNDLADLRAQLEAADAKGARFKMVATDGVFSMDGTVADLAGVCDAAEAHGAMVMVDDSHAVGFMGAKGRGTPRSSGVIDRVDVITGTLGKALGGASGSAPAGARKSSTCSGSSPALSLLQPIAPSIAAAAQSPRASPGSTELRDRLWDNTRYWRAEVQGQ